MITRKKSDKRTLQSKTTNLPRFSQFYPIQVHYVQCVDNFFFLKFHLYALVDAFASFNFITPFVWTCTLHLWNKWWDAAKKRNTHTHTPYRRRDSKWDNAKKNPTKLYIRHIWLSPATEFTATAQPKMAQCKINVSFTLFEDLTCTFKFFCSRQWSVDLPSRWQTQHSFFFVIKKNRQQPTKTFYARLR